MPGSLPTEHTGDFEIYLKATTRQHEIDDLFHRHELEHGLLRLLDLARDFGVETFWQDAAVILLRRYRANTAVGHESQDLIHHGQWLARTVCDHFGHDRTHFSLAPRPTAASIERPTAYDQALNTFRVSTVGPSSDLVVFQCEGLWKKYRRSKTSFQLSDISLELRRGEITGVTGSNGAGKTTLLRIIAGDLSTDGGQISYRLPDADTSDTSVIRQRIAFVSQRPRRWYGTVGDILHRWAALNGIRTVSDNNREVEFQLERHGLSKYRTLRWQELSSGFQMRLELALALITKPSILVLDEPLAPLDIPAQQTFLRDLRNIAQSVTYYLPIIISSQHLYEIEAFASRMLFLKDGRPEFYGPLAALETQQFNCFEISCIVSLTELTQYLTSLPIKSIHEVGSCFHVRTTVNITSAVFLNALISAGINVTYFRDISGSTRILFDKV